MKYIPFYYTDSDFPEFQALPKEDQEQLLKDLKGYEKAVIEAVNAAKSFYIDKWKGKNKGFLYSYTWGKGLNVIDEKGK